MAFIIRVYYDESIYSIDPLAYKEITIGGNTADTLRLPGCNMKGKHIKIFQANNTFNIKAKRMYNREGSPVSSDVLEIGNTYSIDCEPGVRVAVHPKQADSNKVVILESDKEIYIGRELTNDIRFRNMRTSSNHCKIYNEAGIWKIRDLRSSNGTYVNGRRIYEKNLMEGDVISVSIYEIVYAGNMLSFRNVGDDLELNIQNVLTVQNGQGAQSVPYTQPPQPVQPVPDYEAPRRATAVPKSGTMSVFDDVPDARAYTYHSNTSTSKGGTMSVFDSEYASKSDTFRYTGSKGTVSAFGDADDSQSAPVPQYTGTKGTVSFDAGYTSASTLNPYVENNDASPAFGEERKAESVAPQYTARNDAMAIIDSKPPQEPAAPQYTGGRGTMSVFDSDYKKESPTITYTGAKGTVSAFDTNPSKEIGTIPYTGAKGTMSVFNSDYREENNAIPYTPTNDAMAVFGTDYNNGTPSPAPQYAANSEAIPTADAGYPKEEASIPQYTGHKGTMSVFDGEYKKEEGHMSYTGQKGTISAFDID